MNDSIDPKLYKYDMLYSNRDPESFLHYLLWTPLALFLLYILIPSGLGVLIISFGDLFFKIFSFKQGWNAGLLAAVFYMIVISIILAISMTVEPVLEMLRGIDHAIHRMLSIVVVGTSDLFFRGNALAAFVIYWSVFAVQITLGFVIVVWVSDVNTVKYVFSSLAKGVFIQKISLIDVFFSGLAISYALISFLLPIFTAAVPEWRNMMIRPVLKKLDEASLFEKSPNQDTVCVAHITDLHVRKSSLNENDPNWLALSQASSVGEIIVLTGDLTDKGACDEWVNFLQLPVVKEKDERIILVPGNHDLNTWNSSALLSFFRVDTYLRIEAHKRAYLYLQVTSQVMGERAWVLCPFTNAVRRLSHVFAQALPRLMAWDMGDKKSQFLKPADFLQDLFPMVVQSKNEGNEGKVISVVWNTVKANRWALFNSIGEIDKRQVQRAEILLANEKFCERPVLHLMHHQIAVPRDKPVSKNPSLGRLASIHTLGMGLQTAEHLLSFIRKRNQRTCILHGHHHKYFLCIESKSGTPVISSPSSKFGAEVSFSNRVTAGNTPNWLKLNFSVSALNLDLDNVQPM